MKPCMQAMQTVHLPITLVSSSSIGGLCQENSLYVTKWYVCHCIMFIQCDRQLLSVLESDFLLAFNGMPKESPHLYIIKLNVLASLFCFDVTADNPKSFCFFYRKLCAALQGKQQAVSLRFCKAKLAVLQGKACCFARLSLLFCKAASSQLLPCSSNIWVINFFASDFMRILMSK